MAEKNKELTPFQKEQLESSKIIVEYKRNCESNIIACIYKDPDEITNTNLSLDEFSNNEWRVFLQIAHDIIVEQKKKTLDEFTIGFYLQEHPKLAQKYNEYGGFAELEKIKSYVDVKNLDGYISTLRKWNAVLELCKSGFPVKARLSEFADLNANDIYNKFEFILNHIFANVDRDVKTYGLCDGIDDLIESLDKGDAIGLPYYGLDELTNRVGGQYLGSITLVGGISNAGKSTFCRTTTIPSIIEHGEKIVVMLNEEGVEKWQREMIVWVCNNKLKKDIQKYLVRDGNYSNELKDTLIEASNWLKEKISDETIRIIPFQRYNTQQAIKQIKKYASIGYKYFMLDTFKMDAGSINDNSWMAMQQSMVDINDVVKKEALNVHILVTFQLSKGSSVMRYYTQNNIGVAKNIVDPVSTCIMIRDMFQDEFAGGKHELKVYKTDVDKNGNTKRIIIPLDKNKRYQILFIVKNREGAAMTEQIVIEHDLSRNTMKEVGTCIVDVDF